MTERWCTGCGRELEAHEAKLIGIYLPAYSTGYSVTVYSCRGSPECERIATSHVRAHLDGAAACVNSD